MSRITVHQPIHTGSHYAVLCLANKALRIVFHNILMKKVTRAVGEPAEFHLLGVGAGI